MENRRVALVVATYNGEKVIGKCLRSLLKTDYENKEIVVVDDGSTDRTPEILNEFRNRITVLQGNRSGVAGCRNLAARHSGAEFVATTDDDCEARPDWITKAIGSFGDERVAAVTGEKIYKTTNLVSAVRSAEYRVRYRNRTREARSVECPVSVFRKSCQEAVGGFSVWTLVGGEDTDIGYKLKEAGYRIVFEPEMIVYHDPEESFRLYLKRNFRNAVSYVRVFSNRSRQQSLHDDFFPWYVLCQPFFTLIFFLLLVGCVFHGAFLIAAGGLFIVINCTFLNVTGQVLKTRRGVPASAIGSQALLLLRNIAWLGGMLVGLKNLLLKKSARRAPVSEF